ncbi:MAG: aminoacyl-tRNA hydrolase [Clostridia bacterium]|nr:aminoacyl-tRNA hydrolase [Clostridia bacterium]
MADIFELFKKISTGTDAVKGKPEYLVVGLGNPGSEYERTRHNAGFMAVDRISERCSCSVKQSKFKALIGSTTIAGHTVLLMKPQTYMNLSGEAVKECASFYQIPAENIIVISDDICQDVGRMRIRKSGSAGGQKGLANIITHIGTDAVPRIRLGVGKKPTPEYDLSSWVLSRFSDEDMKLIIPRLDDTFESVKLIIEGKLEEAMGKFNGKK